MARNRKKRVIQGDENVHVLDLPDNEGFYPYRLSYDVEDRQDNVTRVFMGPVPNNPKEGAKDTIGRDKRTFHHQYSVKYPDLCREFAIVAATHSIELRHSKSGVSYCLNAIRFFFEFIESEGKLIASFHDICTDVMVEYRAYIRNHTISDDSYYKGTFYHPVKTLLNRVMDTSRGPDSYEIPIYQVDAADKDRKQPYSDMEMYQIIAAAYYDCVVIMEAVQEFEGLVSQGVPKKRRNMKNSAWTLENFAWFYENVMELKRPPYNQEFIENTNHLNHGSTIKNRLGMSTVALIKSKTNDEWKQLARKGQDPRDQHREVTLASKPDVAATWRSEVSFLTHGITNMGNKKPSDYYTLKIFKWRDDLLPFTKPPFAKHLGHSFIQREVATRDTLLPFFILFSIYTGRNSEVMFTWQRTTPHGKCILSLADNADPLNNNAVLMEGWKYRGKRTVKEKDDVSIEVDNLLYSLLEFVIKYTKPLAEYKNSDDIWLYLGVEGQFELCHFRKNHTVATKPFCERHMILDESGKRHQSIDMRHFRKVFLTKELLESIDEHESFETLATDLQNKAKHKSFDTTFSKYLDNDTTKKSLDAAIVSLQRHFLEEAKAYCALMDNSDVNEERVGIPTLQARCDPPNASETEKTSHNCDDYDYCMGCKRSRVYEEHLPRICARLIQYENKKGEMHKNEWSLRFHDKHARAHDVLDRWGKKDQVSRAWELARTGQIKMPVLN